MARHDEMPHLFSDGVYFAYPGRSSQRGTNENTNGLLRQYFPTQTDLRVHSDEDLARIEKRLNTRPRKILGWSTCRRC
jgi:transposase, IS30 family